MSRCSGVFEQYAVFGSSGFARARAALLFAAVVSLTNMSALEQWFARTREQRFFRVNVMCMRRDFVSSGNV